MKAHIQKILPLYREIRHKIHAHPELRYEEIQTAKLITQELENLGLTVQTGIGKTGVVGILDSGKPGKTIALRADMDALPIAEESGLQYGSQVEGKMHACGHDGHVATLLGAAHILCSLTDQFTGKVKFIFQPAEEGGAGALAMIKDGVLENPKVDAIFGYHNHPGAKVGEVLVKPGCMMYGNTEFTLDIRGKSGHAAQPERAINPISICSELILAIHAVMTQLSNDNEPTVITITQIKSGVATNIIPETAFIGGTIRAASREKANIAKVKITEVVNKIIKNFNAAVDLKFASLYPATINPVEGAEFVLKTARGLLGENNVQLKPTSSRASEDFSYFLEKIPGCYFFIGNGEDSPSCHNSKYDFNDGILPVGIELLATLALQYNQM